MDGDRQLHTDMFPTLVCMKMLRVECGYGGQSSDSRWIVAGFPVRPSCDGTSPASGQAHATTRSCPALVRWRHRPRHRGDRPAVRGLEDLRTPRRRPARVHRPTRPTPLGASRSLVSPRTARPAPRFPPWSLSQVSTVSVFPLNLRGFRLGADPRPALRHGSADDSCPALQSPSPSRSPFRPVSIARI